MSGDLDAATTAVACLTCRYANIDQADFSPPIALFNGPVVPCRLRGERMEMDERCSAWAPGGA
jgi:hypothetical protein